MGLLPKYTPGTNIASKERAGTIVSAFKKVYSEDNYYRGKKAGESEWMYIIKSTDRRAIAEGDIIATGEDNVWEEIGDE